MKNNLLTRPKFDEYTHPYLAEWFKAFKAEIEEKLKALPLGLLAYERGQRDAWKEVLGQ